MFRYVGCKKLCRSNRNLLSYYKENGIPKEEFYDFNPSSLIGEDIELFNGMLAQRTQDDSTRADVDALHVQYQNLGVMLHYSEKSARRY